jgi:hypothetical protein
VPAGDVNDGMPVTLLIEHRGTHARTWQLPRCSSATTLVDVGRGALSTSRI